MGANSLVVHGLFGVRVKSLNTKRLLVTLVKHISLTCLVCRCFYFYIQIASGVSILTKVTNW